MNEGQGLSNKEIAGQLKKTVRKECVKMISKEIEESEVIDGLAKGVGKVLADQVKSSEILIETIEEMKEKERRHLEKYEKSLKARYSVRSLIPKWMQTQMTKEKVKS